MTSSTPPPPSVATTPTDDDTPSSPRRFGAARAFGLGLAAFLGGYLALLALTETIDIVRNELWSQYDVFGGQAAVARFRALGLLAEGLGALAGVVAIIGLAARRWALGVLVLTLLSALSHLGFAIQVIDTTYRPVFLEPGPSWGASSGLPFVATVLALQLLIILLSLVRGPKPQPAVLPIAPATDAPPRPDHDELAPPAHAVTDDDDRDPTLVAAPVPGHRDDEAVADDDADDDTSDDVYLVIHGSEYGPYPPERVRGFMVEGRIHPGTLVRVGDETKPASEFPAIYGG